MRSVLGEGFQTGVFLPHQPGELVEVFLQSLELGGGVWGKVQRFLFVDFESCEPVEGFVERSPQAAGQQIIHQQQSQDKRNDQPGKNHKNSLAEVFGFVERVLDRDFIVVRFVQ